MHSIAAHGTTHVFKTAAHEPIFYRLSSKKVVLVFLFILISDIYLLFILLLFFLLLFFLLLFLLVILLLIIIMDGEVNASPYEKGLGASEKSYLFVPLLQLHFLAAGESSIIFTLPMVVLG